MYGDKNRSVSKPSTIIKTLLAFSGAVLLTYAAMSWQDIRSFLSKAERAEGTVVNLAPGHANKSGSLRPVILFTDRSGNPVAFFSDAGGRKPASRRGDTVRVLSLPQKPEGARIDSFSLLRSEQLLSGFTGTLFLLAAAGMVTDPLRKKRRMRMLMERGTAIETRLEAVEQITGIKTGGKSRFQVVSQWTNPATEKKHFFRSEYLHEDPSEYIVTEIIRVFIRRNNPKKYCIDLSFLPKSENKHYQVRP
jgi:hypothetical protein